MLRDAWDAHAEAWITWARAPGHDSYWRFHRDAFLPLVPPPGRLTVDIGCGEGRMGRDLARLGHRVVGVDSSGTMATAAHRHPDRGGPIAVADAAALPLRDAVADCAVAFMSLQDVDAMERAMEEAARVLMAGGCLVMAITHPVNTAGRFDPGSDGDGRPVFVIEGSWFERRVCSETCERDGLTMTFHSEHRPLHDYVDALADAGFVVERLREVGESDPDHKWHRLPLFLHLRARLQ
ncbi:MAG TPA: class I SAM-dependent methyltransferase [Acidimicrobiales bacterium]